MDPDRGRTLRALSATSTPEVTAGARAGLRLCSPANEVSCAGQGVLLTFPALGAPGRAGKEHPALGKGPAAPAHPSCLGRRSCSQGRKSHLLSGRKAQTGQAGECELSQLSTRVIIERLNMNKCCRFIYVSFYLWNVSEWSKDTKMLLETVVSQERQPRP